jgi:hypothetical protein
VQSTDKKTWISKAAVAVALMVAGLWYVRGPFGSGHDSTAEAALKRNLGSSDKAAILSCETQESVSLCLFNWNGSLDSLREIGRLDLAQVPGVSACQTALSDTGDQGATYTSPRKGIAQMDLVGVYIVSESDERQRGCAILSEP